jgi:hypothetical protein
VSKAVPEAAAELPSEPVQADAERHACLPRFRSFLVERGGERVPIKLFACITSAAAVRMERRAKDQTGLKRSDQEEL